jgi:hypothetical protein
VLGRSRDRLTASFRVLLADYDYDEVGNSLRSRPREEQMDSPTIPVAEEPPRDPTPSFPHLFSPLRGIGLNLTSGPGSFLLGGTN